MEEHTTYSQNFTNELYDPEEVRWGFYHFSMSYMYVFICMTFFFLKIVYTAVLHTVMTVNVMGLELLLCLFPDK